MNFRRGKYFCFSFSKHFALPLALCPGLLPSCCEPAQAFVLNIHRRFRRQKTGSGEGKEVGGGRREGRRKRRGREMEGIRRIQTRHPLAFFLKRRPGGESCSEALLSILDASPLLSFNPSHILTESIVAKLIILP